MAPVFTGVFLLRNYFTNMSFTGPVVNYDDDVTLKKFQMHLIYFIITSLSRRGDLQNNAYNVVITIHDSSLRGWRTWKNGKNLNLISVIQS